MQKSPRMKEVMAQARGNRIWSRMLTSRDSMYYDQAPWQVVFYVDVWSFSTLCKWKQPRAGTKLNSGGRNVSE
jgi:hypothetical protein